MAQAKIKINAVVGSNDDLPINALVSLDNQNNGGETAFAWSIIDQPSGAADALSSLVIQTPTFTPKKEGTYLLQLIVNPGPLQLVDRVIVGIRQLKTRDRVPAADEDIETGARGWADAVGAFMQRQDAQYGAEAGVLVGVNGEAFAMARGDLLFGAGNATIKAGLPGEEKLPSFLLATDSGFVGFPQMFWLGGQIFILEGGVDGSAAPASGALIRARYYGRFQGLTDFPGSWTIGEDVYSGLTSNRVAPFSTSFTVGSWARRIGTVLKATNPIDILFDGSGRIPAPHHIMFGASLLPNIITTTYMFPCYQDSPTVASEISIPILFPCHLFGLRLHATASGTGINQQVATLRLNGVDTLITATLAPLATDAQDTSGQFIMANPATDNISMKIDTTSVGISGPTGVVVTVACLPIRPLF